MESISDDLEDHLEQENAMNLKKNKVGKRFRIICSDSEDENENPTDIFPQKGSSHETVHDNFHTESIKRNTSIITTDSENEPIPLNWKTDDEMLEKQCLNKEPAPTVFNSSEEYEEISTHNKSFPGQNSTAETAIYTMNNKGKLIPENSFFSIKNSDLSTLCDSESSENEEDTSKDTPLKDLWEDNVLEPKLYKSKKGNRNDLPKKMTAQEALKQRTEIQSESQRMLRESNVTLPYHKPKSYTIQEFLQKRSKLTSTLPTSVSKAPPSVALKMSKDQLKEVSKKLDERIKEVEKFYKSESEEDDDKEYATEFRTWLNLLAEQAMDMAEKTSNATLAENAVQETVIGNLLQHSNQPVDGTDTEFNVKNTDEKEVRKKIDKSELIKDKLSVQPRLTGTPDDIIDLEMGVTKPNEVKKLMDKLFQHNSKKVIQKHKVHLNVVGVTHGGEVVEETISMNVDEEERPIIVDETPGAKLQRLKEELQLQITQRKIELWKQKQEQGDCLIEKKFENDQEKVEKDILDDEEEEFELTESESEIDEEEEESHLEQENPKKYRFIDEEACEDGLEANEEVDDESTSDVDVTDDLNDNQDKRFDEDIEDLLEKEQIENPKKKILKRIKKPFIEDSDDDDACATTGSPRIIKFHTIDDDDILPPNLPRTNVTPLRPQLEKNKTELDFLTPVTYLTGLQNLNSDSKLKEQEPIFDTQSIFSPTNEKNIESQKKMFEANTQWSSLEGSVQDLEALCSGKFSETQNPETEKNCADTFTEEIPPTTQELLNICSGNFSMATESKSSDRGGRDISQKVVPDHSNAEKEMKSLDSDQDEIISQLLDEDELERFKKKFESPINTTLRKSQITEDIEEVNATGLINSDDETEPLKIKKNRNHKKLVFSDDENSDDNDDVSNPEDNEEIDLYDSDPDDEEQQLENEIEVQQSSTTFKLTDFLDKEAELSGSDWDSADEDEKDLDELEFEQGDQETFNENKMRAELERIHMRQILDEDNREVKLLQELLLEDGELHGTGRKRQFRWKAVDSDEKAEFEKRDDDDIFLDEEENEKEWRKMRHKREMFLKKKVVAKDDDAILSDSQILKVGQKILKNRSSNSQNNNSANKTEECKEPFDLLSKRGSFLSRNDQVLQRLVEYNKVTTNAVGSSAKNTRCFVFQSVETSHTTVVKDNNKRKATEGTPTVIKKLRLDDLLSPANVKNKTSKTSRAKKLFGNW